MPDVNDPKSNEKKVGVLLSGCGVYDGSEIHEATLTLYFLAKAGAKAICIAPDIPQKETVDHLSGQETGERRRVLVESSRIARGEIVDIRDISAQDLDALILPGGFGAAKNLSDFADAGESCRVHEEVRRLIREMVRRKKPLGAMCIAPAVVARALQGLEDMTPTMTIGTDQGTAKKLEMMGVIHVIARVDEAIVDEENKIVTTPAYMLGPGIAEIARGIENLVSGLMNLID